jgi:hypothetical protein
VGPVTSAGVAADGSARAAELLDVAATLRWARPDLTAALAEHVLAIAEVTGAATDWMAAAGWFVHGRAATGDARPLACELLDRAGAADARALLAAPAGARFRVELGALMHGGDPDTARELVEPLPGSGTDRWLQADALGLLARCAEDPAEVRTALSRCAAAWTAVGEPVCGAATVALLTAHDQRVRGAPAQAVEHAAEGLARLRGAAAPHLEAALAAELISALLAAGRTGEARAACAELVPRPGAVVRASSQLVRLRLLAVQAGAEDPLAQLEQAAGEAAEGDIPGLEAVCRSALSELHEADGRLDAALASLRAASVAERVDQRRDQRLRRALRELRAGRATTTRVSGPAAATDGAAAAMVVNPPGAPAGRSTPAAHPDPDADPVGCPRPGRTEGAAREGAARDEAAGDEAAGEGAARDEAAGVTGVATHPWEAQPPTSADDSAGGGTDSRQARRPTADGRALPRADRSTTDVSAATSGDRGGGVGDGAAAAGAPAAGPGEADDGAGAGAVDPRPPGDGAPAVLGPAVVDELRGRGSWEDPLGGSLIGDILLRELSARPAKEVVPSAAPPAPDPAPVDEAAAAEAPTEVGTTSTTGSVVVLDVVTDGARMTGRDVESVVAAVRTQLAAISPAGARLRKAEPAVVSVVLPGYGCVETAGWMRSVLPDLVAVLPAEGDLPGASLRASVHDAVGRPSGAEILQRLVRRSDPRPPGGAEAGPAHRADPAPLQDRSATPEAGRPRHDAAGRRPYLPPGVEVRPGGGGRRRRAAGHPPSGATRRPIAENGGPVAAGSLEMPGVGRNGSGLLDSPGDRRCATDDPTAGGPGSGNGLARRGGTDRERVDSHRVDDDDGPARRDERGHTAAVGADAAGVAAGSAAGAAGSGAAAAGAAAGVAGPGAFAAESDSDAAGSAAPAGEPAPPVTEALGLADLLAGALAAYRSL